MDQSRQVTESLLILQVEKPFCYDFLLKWGFLSFHPILPTLIASSGKVMNELDLEICGGKEIRQKTNAHTLFFYEYAEFIVNVLVGFQPFSLSHLFGEHSR